MSWEYKILIWDGEINSNEEFETQLNEYGDQGWELIIIVPQISSMSDSSFGDLDINITCCEEVYVKANVCIFKRKNLN